jgi:N-methylhydantoinase B
MTFGPYSGAIFSALTAQLASDLSGVYGGVYRCVDFELEPGLLSSPNHPAAISYTGASPVGAAIYTATLAVGKMLSCSRDSAVRALALGPTIPAFYTNGLEFIREDGSLDLFSSIDGMIGSLGAMPGRDGVAGGGHSWIPEGIAPNIENYEQQSPLLFLYRRYMPGGADGAGRTRGGLGVEQAFVAHGSSGGSASSHMNESFPKSQGQWGGNPGSRAFFRIHRGVDLARRLARSDIPASSPEIGGEARAIPFKGAAEPLGPTDVIEWASPTTAGWGDPLSRPPEAVAADIGHGDFTPTDAERVYAVRLTRGGDVDRAATEALRRQRRAQRLGAEPRRDPAPVDSERPGLAVGDQLCLHRGRWACRCGEDLGPQDADYKNAARLTERSIRTIAPEFETDDPDMADLVVFREFLCPGCGVRLDTEITRRGDPMLQDVAIHEVQ